jgi:voltage-gated potassium channel
MELWYDRAMAQTHSRQRAAWRDRLHAIIFEAETPAGKAFDIILLISIGISVLVVMLESVPVVEAHYGRHLLYVEWFFTLLFTIEYVLRLISVLRPLAYARSFFGIVDFLSIVPTYLGLFISGAQYLLVIRILRLLRIFRVLKLVEYLEESRELTTALWASRRKISVFLLTVVTLVFIIGAAMYVIEGPQNGFTSIPISIYWAVVTLTTVGYGDITPQTTVGKTLATIVMLMGYGIIAVPTGIVTMELSRGRPRPQEALTRACPTCGREGHDPDAEYCKYCGSSL